jgi:hypothetical protein
MTHSYTSRDEQGSSTWTTCGRSEYVCYCVHRNGTPRKSQWEASIREVDECHLFCGAEAANSSAVAAREDLWIFSGIDGPAFGSQGELFVRFMLRSGGSTAWHGHPVGKNSPSVVKSPPKTWIDAWAAGPSATRAVAKKMRQGVL